MISNLVHLFERAEGHPEPFASGQIQSLICAFAKISDAHLLSVYSPPTDGNNPKSSHLIQARYSFVLSPQNGETNVAEDGVLSRAFMTRRENSEVALMLKVAGED